MGAGGDRSVAGALRKTPPDFAGAEVNLMANVISIVKKDGVVKFKRGDNARDIYNEYDGKDSLGERYLKLILKHEPHLLEVHPEAFDYLFEEDEVEGLDEVDMLAEDPKPTLTSVESSVYQVDEQT